MRRALLAAAVLLVITLAGCTNPFANPPTPGNYSELAGYARDTTGRNATAWPDLADAKITLLDQGAFGGFDDAAAQFKTLTGITVKKENGHDTLDALKTLQRAKHSGKYDVVYGIDNMVYYVAARGGDLTAYKPHLADRIDPKFLFFGNVGNDTWYATPVDHGYIGINVDTNATGLNETVDTLARVQRWADKVVTEDPAVSSPGLGFLLVTVDKYGENPTYSTALYDWKAYWTDLFKGPDRNLDKKSDGCILVAKDWTEAYTQHFSAAGSWVDEGALRDKPIVVSYTESPAYEVSGGMLASNVAKPIFANGTTYHQIQTSAIANGTKNLMAAQAWVEFTLTDEFQKLAAPKDGVYPVVASVSVNGTYKGLDPAPGSFRSVEMPAKYVADNLDRWQKAWRALYQNPDINCNL